MIVFGITDPIQAPLRELLIWLHSSIGLTWAWSIVALTIIVRTVLLPLTVRQIHSMQNLQKHAPEMKEIQQKYKGDRQRLNEELMRFYKENNINPASSCLPLLAQLPVFISLFFVLREFEQNVLPDFPASDLGWLGLLPSITDRASSHWSGFLLLAIYAISQTTSTLLMSTTMERMQRMLLLFLPLVFLFFILNFPAGLVLYWVTTNLWTTGQGLITRQLMPKPQAPPKRSSRTPPKTQAEIERDAAEADAKLIGPATAPVVRKVKRKKKKKKGARR
ncbi:MAG: YidC/Oxa1 family membrane protein insertase [Thermoleophilia bacterium]|nr:YidC/Oxa1 family membrane protein insertase [Thermoleophilia bacterium]